MKKQTKQSRKTAARKKRQQLAFESFKAVQRVAQKNDMQFLVRLGVAKFENLPLKAKQYIVEHYS